TPSRTAMGSSHPPNVPPCHPLPLSPSVPLTFLRTLQHQFFSTLSCTADSPDPLNLPSLPLSPTSTLPLVSSHLPLDPPPQPFLQRTPIHHCGCIGPSRICPPQHHRSATCLCCTSPNCASPSGPMGVCCSGNYLPPLA
ncbi:unnamed protein product, partial [Closterium sp. Naga37s-1]